ncbi:MAG: hypothetical protein JKX91_04745 [Rhizobiaceae bacterium]|nr:hypothetical protein [Rhizobiaceae bacterium]
MQLVWERPNWFAPKGVEPKGATSFGRKALIEKQGKPLVNQLAAFTIGYPKIALLGCETILRNGERVGWLSSAGWGYTLEKNIGYGYIHRAEGVDREFILGGEYELDVTTHASCARSMWSLYATWQCEKSKSQNNEFSL